MEAKRQWLMTEQMYEKFTASRKQLYPPQLKPKDDSLMTHYYLHVLIHFLRKRKIVKQMPFVIEKLLYTASALFKRYYLVNQYQEAEQAPQNLLCCLYLALKLNQYTEQDICKHAKSWKARQQPKVLMNDSNLHFGDEGYSEKQLAFLSNIGFQIGRSPLIQPLQALHHQVSMKIHTENKQQLIKIIHGALDKIYYDSKIMFLYPGPKLAIALELLILKKINPQIKHIEETHQYFNAQIVQILKQKKVQIQELLQIINQIKVFHINEHQVLIKEFNNLLKTKKKGFENPGKKSPRLSPKYSQLRDKDL